MITKKNVFKFLFFYLISTFLLLVLNRIAETKLFQLFTIEQIGNPDLEWNDLHYKSVNPSTNVHYTREKSVVLINTGSLNRDSFRLELSKVLTKLKKINAKAVGIDHQFSAEPFEEKIGTKELIESINANPKIVAGKIEDVNNPNKLSKELKIKAIRGKADLPDDYTIRTYYDQSSTFANQLIKIAFPSKFSNSEEGNEPFTINYSCLNDGLVEYSNTSENLDSINFKYIEAKEFIDENESGFNHSFTKTFKNKIVIIGHLGSNLINKKYDVEDKFSVPTDTSKIMLRDKTMYGSVIHANAIENILHPETKFKELNSFFSILLDQFFIIGMLLLLFLNLGKLINISIVIVLSVIYAVIIMKLMDFNIYITMASTLFQLLFLEEFFEIIEPLYNRVVKLKK